MAKIKICGLSRARDIDYVNEAKPDWCGFVINFPKSARNVSPDEARALRAALREEARAVGVFADAPAEVAAELFNDGTLSVVQLHGSEDERYISALRELAPGVEVWKAFKVKSRADIEAANASSADFVLLDGGQGAGRAFDWALARAVTRPFILAGGLTPENIPLAVRTLRPYGVDVSSGVESGGKKDKEKIAAAVKAAKGE